MEKGKPEINLEISAGFFRIPTENAIYNITVLGNEGSSVTRVVEKIVEHEQNSARGADFTGSASGDDFYKNISNDIYNDIGRLAKSLSSTIMEIPAEDRQGERAKLDDAGEKIEAAKDQLKDIVSMTEKATMEIMDQVEMVHEETDAVKDLLSILKDHKAFSATEASVGFEDETGKETISFSEKISQVRGALEKAGSLLEEINLLGDGGISAESVSEVPQKTRYLFQLDPVFQTIYELCTNETVKGHISAARGRANEIFDYDRFVDAISPKVESLPEEDGFLTVPLADVFGPLSEACKDKGTKNLLKKMDAGKGDIFLDQSLPLEMPETEIVGGRIETAAGESMVPDSRIDEIRSLLAESLTGLDEIPETSGSGTAGMAENLSVMTFEDQKEIFKKIENAFNGVTNISNLVFRITEVLSFQDLSGQQIMKIIKLLSDFQIQLLAIVVSFGTQLKSKEKKPDISHEESKQLAQEEVDTYLGKVGGAKEPGAPLDQDTVNKMLEEMGF
ncbi:MAG: protein phosphatase CheZ [Proteobacteria bacterium]|nr:protein phosphatase CheZ [Pseudomonadota bacterium]MBU1710854.1 protein phosphatase CheZ [Pseudomonadota bacterium]